MFRPLLPLTVIATATFASSAAFAQANCTTTRTGTVNAGAVAFAAGQSMAAISGAISSVETAFLSQQGSAFVSAPGNPAAESARRRRLGSRCWR